MQVSTQSSIHKNIGREQQSEPSVTIEQINKVLGQGRPVKWRIRNNILGPKSGEIINITMI